MRGPEIMKEITERLTPEHKFVKWWRKENDFLDYNLVGRFLDNFTINEEIGGINLLTMDEMWDEVKRISGDSVKLVHGDQGDILEWVYAGKEGAKTFTCAYTPENLIKIFDTETRGNPIH